MVYKALCRGTWPCTWGKRGECRPSLWGPVGGRWGLQQCLAQSQHFTSPSLRTARWWSSSSLCGDRKEACEVEGRAMCPVPSCRLGTMEFKRLFTCLEHTHRALSSWHLLAPLTPQGWDHCCHLRLWIRKTEARGLSGQGPRAGIRTQEVSPSCTQNLSDADNAAADLTVGSREGHILRLPASGSGTEPVAQNGLCSLVRALEPALPGKPQ